MNLKQNIRDLRPPMKPDIGDLGRLRALFHGEKFSAVRGFRGHDEKLSIIAEPFLCDLGDKPAAAAGPSGGIGTGAWNPAIDSRLDEVQGDPPRRVRGAAGKAMGSRVAVTTGDTGPSGRKFNLAVIARTCYGRAIDLSQVTILAIHENERIKTLRIGQHSRAGISFDRLSTGEFTIECPAAMITIPNVLQATHVREGGNLHQLVRNVADGIPDDWFIPSAVHASADRTIRAQTSTTAGGLRVTVNSSKSQQRSKVLIRLVGTTSHQVYREESRILTDKLNEWSLVAPELLEPCDLCLHVME